jgi:hypothetical protein
MFRRHLRQRRRRELAGRLGGFLGGGRVASTAAIAPDQNHEQNWVPSPPAPFLPVAGTVRSPGGHRLRVAGGGESTLCATTASQFGRRARARRMLFLEVIGGASYSPRPRRPCPRSYRRPGAGRLGSRWLARQDGRWTGGQVRVRRQRAGVCDLLRAGARAAAGPRGRSNTVVRILGRARMITRHDAARCSARMTLGGVGGSST